MANEESGSPLRRWRPFYGAFGAIDSAIEAGGHPRSAFREVRSRIVALLRGAADDEGVAEQLCAALDDAMAESLRTLRVAPVPHSALASTDLATAVGALGNHGSARIRSLADDVVRGWRAAGYVATAPAVKKQLDNNLSVSGDRIPRQGISAMVADGNARESVVPAAAAAEVHMKLLYKPPAKMFPVAAVIEVHKKKLHIPPPKMLPTAAAATTEAHKKKLYIPPAPPVRMISTAATVSGRRNTSEAEKKPVVAQSKKMEAKKPTVAQSKAKKMIVAQSEKMETTKRKLRESYQDAERVKRQHTIRINDREAAKMFEQKQRKVHPIVRATSTSRTSSCVRRSLLPSLQMI